MIRTLGFLIWMLGTCAASPLVTADGTPREILTWHPGLDEPPRPNVLVERFKNNDLGIAEADFFGQHAAFGSVVQYFCGDDPALRQEFAGAFEKYLAHKHNGQYPGYAQPEHGNCTIYTYRTPYEYSQPEFQQWLARHTGKRDICEPAGRRFNEYRGPVKCPWLPAGIPDQEYLKSTFGYAVYPDGRSLVLLSDNRLNPMRWAGPVNEVHHREQSSLCLTINSNDGEWERTAQLLRDFRAGTTDRRILLQYDIELEVGDYRAETLEYTLWDYYGGYDLTQQPQGIVSQTHRNTVEACQGKQFGGQSFSAGQKLLNLSWLETRLINVNLQCSLSVNFRQREGVYRLSDFMLAAKSQSARPWNLTPNKIFNAYAVDGGGGYGHAWYRTSIELLRDEHFAGQGPARSRALLKGDPYIEIPDGGLAPTRVRGEIDLTQYYALARKNECFPGQKCRTGDGWAGFEGDDATKADPQERHGIEWIGFIFENHGPFRIQATIHALNVREVAQ